MMTDGQGSQTAVIKKRETKVEATHEKIGGSRTEAPMRRRLEAAGRRRRPPWNP